MNHKKYEEILQLNFLDELSENEKVDLENHLLECSECNKEYLRLNKLHTLIVNEKPPEPGEEDLTLARTKLFNTKRTIEGTPTLVDSFKNFFIELFTTNYKFAFGSIALLMGGVFAGYLFFGTSNKPPKILSKNIVDLDKVIDLKKLASGDVNISHISFPETQSDDGIFEFRIGNNIPIVYKGNLSDSIVQRLLANALVETKNPGFRIKTVSMIAHRAKSIFNPDPQIKQALIYSLKNDNNPVVRKKSLIALSKFFYEEEIRDALLFTLSNDENASNRIEAINTLSKISLKNQSPDSSLLQLLEKNIMNENNELIKLKTAKLLLRGN
ncbi:MAG: HEAT repeat domain-containing protein [Melioribacteraceae bacterium]